MPYIEVDQHIYGVVERDASPTNQAGFQTLGCSRQLDVNDLDELEARAFYVTTHQAPPKHVYYTLPSGLVVIGQTVALEETDHAGRSGRSISHHLILTPEMFAMTSANPWVILDHFPFHTRVQDALEAIRQGLTTYTLSNTDTLSLPDTHLPQQPYSTLVLLAYRALSGTAPPVILIGSPEEQKKYLSTAISFLPDTHRAACTFDTWFEKGQHKHTPYWAVGLSRASASPLSTVLELAAPESWPKLNAEGLFEYWLMAGIRNKKWEDLCTQRGAAHAIATWLEALPAPPPSTTPTDPALWTQFLSFNPEYTATHFLSLTTALVNEKKHALLALLIPWLAGADTAVLKALLALKLPPGTFHTALESELRSRPEKRSFWQRIAQRFS